MIRQYFAALRSQSNRYQNAAQRREISGPLSIETIRSHTTALKRFFSWCQLEYYLNADANPMLRIRMPPRSSHQPKAIALDDLRKLFEICGDDLKGKRDRAMLAFMADTGCRAGGLLALRPENLYLDQGRAILREKGGKTRVVPFTRFTAQLMREWLEVRPIEAVTIFCNLGFDEHYARPLSGNGLYQAIKRLKTKAGVIGRCNPHSFRHGFARAYLENGGDLATLAQLMGHSDVKVTAAFYAVFTDGELARRHEMFSPLRGLGGVQDSDPTVQESSGRTEPK
jgi:site-specific recombinase XerD